MLYRVLSALALAATLFVATPALAQEHAEQAAGEAEDHGGHGAAHIEDVVTPDNHEFWGAVLNFLLLIAVIGYLGKKPLQSFLTNRKTQIEEGLEEASRLKAAAEAKHEEYTARLKKLDKELEQLRADMIKAGEAERDRIIEEAEAKAARLRRDAEFLIEQQMKTLEAELRREAVSTAIAAAEKVLAEKTTAADQQKLADRYLARLDERAGDPPDKQGPRPGERAV